MGQGKTNFRVSGVTNRSVRRASALCIPLLCLLVCSSCFSQKKIKTTNVTGISGTAYVDMDITPRQARENALTDAKKNALRAAGIAEHITASDVAAGTSQGTDYKQLFTGISTAELAGAVTDYTITDERRNCDGPGGTQVIKITLNATVAKYETSRDASFEFKAEGIREAYKAGEQLKFRFTPFSDGYLKIFALSDTENQLLFPGPYDKNRLFSKSTSVDFPSGVSYTLGTAKEREVTHLVFVFTKTDIPYTATPDYDYKKVVNYIYSIPPDERNVKYFSYLVSGN